MKYQVMYRLTHPEYLPTTSIQVVDAYTHQELVGALAKMKAKWETQGYHVRIMRVMDKQTKKGRN